MIHATQIKEDEAYFCSGMGKKRSRRFQKWSGVFFRTSQRNIGQEETIAHQEGASIAREFEKVMAFFMQNSSQASRPLNKFQILPTEGERVSNINAA